MLHILGMLDCKSISTPMLSKLKKLQDQATVSDLEYLIGFLMYLIHTRLDIYHDVNTLIQLMCEPKHIHMVVFKPFLRYVRETIAYGLRYTSVEVKCFMIIHIQIGWVVQWIKRVLSDIVLASVQLCSPGPSGNKAP
jgi:hypothetical protein